MTTAYFPGQLSYFYTAWPVNAHFGQHMGFDKNKLSSPITATWDSMRTGDSFAETDLYNRFCPCFYLRILHGWVSFF